jgi:hypothetical protein
MLFNLFGRKQEGCSRSIFEDKVYISSGAKMNACIQLAKEQPSILFVAWFSETARKYRDLLIKNGLEESRVTEARLVHTAQLQNHVPVFLEHHLLHEKEIALAEKLEQKKLIVYSSLDEPLFNLFGSDKIISMMRQMGMKEDEAIVHQLVTKSITRAQEKIAGKISVEQSANSQAEWLERNLK